MSKLILTINLVFLAACASPPKYSDVKAPVAGHIRSLKVKGEPVPPGVCHLWIQGVRIEISDGSSFRADVPVGKYEMGRVSCDPGFMHRNYSLKVAHVIDVRPNVLNLLGDFEWTISTSGGAVEMFLVGGEVYGSFLIRPLQGPTLKTFLAKNPDLKPMKQNTSMSFR